MNVTSLVGGFSITPDNIPDAWIFVYWLAPIHYALEGIIVTQFHGADNVIEDLPDEPTVEFHTTTHDSDGHFGGFFVYSHRFQNIILLAVFCAFFRIGTLWALAFIDYTTR